MAGYKSTVKLPTILLVLFIAGLAYYANTHWDVYPALQGVGHFAVILLGVIAAIVVFDVVVGGFFWIAGAIGRGIGGLFGTQDKRRK